MSKYTTRELLDKVTSWREHDVVDGALELSDDFMEQRITDLYGHVDVANEHLPTGMLIRYAQPQRFNDMRNDCIRDELTDELWRELERENFDDFEFEDDFDPEDDDEEE